MKKLSILIILLISQFSFNLSAECIEGNCVNGQGTFNLPNGDQYIGEWKDHKRHGQGTYNYLDGNQYIGEWKDNTKHGKGTYTWSDGSQYIGEWKDGNYHGQGTLTWANGDQHIGEWKDSKKNGQGTYTYEDGSQYIGEWKDNTKHGKGTFTFANGDQYVGEFMGTRHGQGIITKADGEQYIGEWKDGNYHGQGTFTFANGDQYIGEWKDHKQHGQGTYKVANGDQYSGEWKDGTMLNTNTAQARDRRIAEAKQAREEEERRRVAEKIAKENKLIEISSGTGFFINDKGYFVSNNHVVEICSEVKTKNEGQTYTANIIAVDKKNDLALGKVNFSDNDYISMSDDGARLGEEVIVAGFPFQQHLSESIKVTQGIISSLSGPGNDYSIFQMDAAVQPGNSGGPIINNQGELIGITVAKANSEAFYEETGSLPENINFGIKVETLKPFLSANKIKQPWSFFSSSNSMNGVELADKANNTTIHLQCWNTIASLRELVKDNKVRNLLIDID